MLNSFQMRRDLDGKRTDLLIQSFADRVLVLITQMGKVGNLVQATLPGTIPLPSLILDPSRPNRRPLPPPSPATQLTSLLGSASSEQGQTLQAVYAAQIATIIWHEEARELLDTSRRSVIVGLALKKLDSDSEANVSDTERIVFEGVMGMLQDAFTTDDR